MAVNSFGINRTPINGGGRALLDGVGQWAAVTIAAADLPIPTMTTRWFVQPFADLALPSILAYDPDLFSADLSACRDATWAMTPIRGGIV